MLALALALAAGASVAVIRSGKASFDQTFRSVHLAREVGVLNACAVSYPDVQPVASVIDDIEMGITHVIRAEEWLSSLPKHVRLYEAFGWQLPVFCHLPLLRNADRSKISKRKNPVSLNFFKRAGFLPEAMLNYLALMGWTMPDEQEIFSLDEFVAERLEQFGPYEDAMTTRSATVFHSLLSPLLNLGLLTPDEYDTLVRDITNFLTYVGEPSKLERR